MFCLKNVPLYNEKNLPSFKQDHDQARTCIAKACSTRAVNAIKFKFLLKNIVSLLSRMLRVYTYTRHIYTTAVYNALLQNFQYNV